MVPETMSTILKNLYSCNSKRHEYTSLLLNDSYVYVALIKPIIT